MIYWESEAIGNLVVPKETGDVIICDVIQEPEVGLVEDLC